MGSFLGIQEVIEIKIHCRDVINYIYEVMALYLKKKVISILNSPLMDTIYQNIPDLSRFTSSSPWIPATVAREISAISAKSHVSAKSQASQKSGASHGSAYSTWSGWSALTMESAANALGLVRLGEVPRTGDEG